ncbi:PQ-loop domain-containing transporter [Spiroplasma ixodetis]|uniref:PQ-loop domain-containing transporter n=1 Tax=Spiroplasma ixodetis TaxID=2141 RepID=UPI003D7CC598
MKMQTFIGIIGYLTGILSIITFIPQAIKTIKTKETKHIILSTYIIYNIANLFFLDIWNTFSNITSNVTRRCWYSWNCNLRFYLNNTVYSNNDCN